MAARSSREFDEWCDKYMRLVHELLNEGKPLSPQEQRARTQLTLLGDHKPIGLLKSLTELFGFVDGLMGPLSLEHPPKAQPPPLSQADFSVRIGPSVVHGQGVFAQCDIEPGSLVTFYPKHIITQTVVPGRDAAPLPAGITQFDATFDPSIPSSLVAKYDSRGGLESLYGFRLPLNDTYSLFGLPDLVQDAAFLGHMVNDAATVFTDTDVYLEGGFHRMNAMYWALGRDVVAIVSTRAIRAGEEVLVLYGYEYWTGCAKCHLRQGGKCTRCCQVSYCCKECQRADWRHHKRSCKAFAG